MKEFEGMSSQLNANIWSPSTRLKVMRKHRLEYIYKAWLYERAYNMFTGSDG
jgi:hypothetical protein